MPTNIEARGSATENRFETPPCAGGEGNEPFPQIGFSSLKSKVNLCAGNAVANFNFKLLTIVASPRKCREIPASCVIDFNTHSFSFGHPANFPTSRAMEEPTGPVHHHSAETAPSTSADSPAETSSVRRPTKKGGRNPVLASNRTTKAGQEYANQLRRAKRVRAEGEDEGSQKRARRPNQRNEDETQDGEDAMSSGSDSSSSSESDAEDEEETNAGAEKGTAHSAAPDAARGAQDNALGTAPSSISVLHSGRSESTDTAGPAPSMNRSQLDDSGNQHSESSTPLRDVQKKGTISLGLLETEARRMCGECKDLPLDKDTIWIMEVPFSEILSVVQSINRTQEKPKSEARMSGWIVMHSGAPRLALEFFGDFRATTARIPFTGFRMNRHNMHGTQFQEFSVNPFEVITHFIGAQPPDFIRFSLNKSPDDMGCLIVEIAPGNSETGNVKSRAKTKLLPPSDDDMELYMPAQMKWTVFVDIHVLKDVLSICPPNRLAASKVNIRIYKLQEEEGRVPVAVMFVIQSDKDPDFSRVMAYTMYVNQSKESNVIKMSMADSSEAPGITVLERTMQPEISFNVWTSSLNCFAHPSDNENQVRMMVDRGEVMLSYATLGESSFIYQMALVEDNLKNDSTGGDASDAAAASGAAPPARAGLHVTPDTEEEE